MPPRKSAPAGEDDQCPTLKLTMEKGPLSGQTNEFRPGSRVNIGRVVRGNTIAIKDAGVSSKHLVIQEEAVSDLGRRSWTVTDLGSSNGTFLNGEQLDPSEPAVLSDGDVVIIGEITSIKVKFEFNVGKNEVSSGNVRRNARRRARNQVAELGVIDEDSELGLGDKYLGAKNEGLENGDGKLETVDEGKGRGRRTRGFKARGSENLGEQVEVKKENLGKASSKVTRSSKKEESLADTVIDGDEDEEISDEVSEVKVKQSRIVGLRKTRSSKNNENTLKDLNINVGKDLEPRESVRRTRSSRKEEGITEIGIDLDVIEGKRTRKGTRGSKKLPVDTTPLEEELNLEDKECDKEEKKLDGVDELEERVSSGKEAAAGLASTSGVKENEVDVRKGEKLADLETMTLGEWLDFLQVFLPKQIIDETEMMLSEMSQKAERLHDFMLQQNNAKKQGEVAKD